MIGSGEQADDVLQRVDGAGVVEVVVVEERSEPGVGAEQEGVFLDADAPGVLDVAVG